MFNNLLKTAFCVCLLSSAANLAGAAVSEKESYPVAAAITHKIELRNAALAVMEGYNAHVRDQAAKKQTQADVLISQTFPSVSSAGILDVRYRYPMSAREKNLRDALLVLTDNLIKKQNTFSKIQRENAFCALKQTLFLYPAVKFQKSELDSVRQEKVLYRVLHMCPGQIRKIR